jgi:nitroreductase
LVRNHPHPIRQALSTPLGTSQDKAGLLPSKGEGAEIGLEGDPQTFKDLVLENRTYRKYHEEFQIDNATLREPVDLARCSASTGNLQALKYILLSEPERNNLIFPNIFLARKDQHVRYPPNGGRPSAYIIMLGDKRINETFAPDHGIAAQSILLGAREKGLGGCMVMMLKRDVLFREFQIPQYFQILMVIRLGKPDETVVLEEAVKGGDTMFYWEGDTRHVPKRALDDIIIASYTP